VLIKSGSEVGAPAIPYSTGTVARIDKASRAEDGQRIFVSVSGRRRFRIQSITQYRPYMKADVEMLTEDDDISEMHRFDEIQQAINEYARLTVGLRGGWVDRARLPSEPGPLSYFLADMLQISMRNKQALLERPTARERLEAEWQILKRESQAMREKVAREFQSRFSKH
jgi:Lon protease-like protein